MQKAPLMARITEFVEGLSEKDDVGVLVHCDPDGLAAAVVILEAIQQKTGKEAKTVACSPYGNHDLMQKKLDLFQFSRCNKLIVADLSFDQDGFFFSKAQEFCEGLLFIDHHKVYADYNSEKTVFVKVQFVSEIDPSKYPASKLCFDLFSEFVDVSGVAWVAAVGILGDASGLQWKDFLQVVMQKNNCSYEQLVLAKEVIEAVGLLEPHQFGDLTRAFFLAKGPQEIIDSPFANARAEMNAEIDFWMKKFSAEKEWVPELELVWFECKPRFPVKAPLVNKISFELHPNQTVIFVQDLREKDPFISISARRQDGKVKMNDLLENAVKGIPNALAGGHAPASGGKIPREYLAQFKKNVISELQKLYQT